MKKILSCSIALIAIAFSTLAFAASWGSATYQGGTVAASESFGHNWATSQGYGNYNVGVNTGSACPSAGTVYRWYVIELQPASNSPGGIVVRPGRYVVKLYQSICQ